MEKRTEEWFKQADYDLDTADYMYRGGRRSYAVFMSHLAVEKALKGLYHEKLRTIPPKSHNLIFLLTEIGLHPPDEHGRFIVRLNGAAVSTRYPEELAAATAAYTDEVVHDILKRSQEVVQWIKGQS